MVETLAPASHRSSANPKKAQIFLSDQALGMDQSSNLGQSFFPPISSSFSSSSSSASARKQTLSKPRMVKSRKGASSKPRPDATRPDKLEEKLSSWNPFASDPRASATDGSVFGSGGAPSRNSSRRSAASSGSGAFVFGSGVGPDLSGNSSIGADEGRKLPEERDGSNVGKSGGFGEGLGSGPGVFVFGSGAKMSHDSNPNSAIGSEGREKLNVGKNGGFGEGTFVFGSSVDKGSEKKTRSNRRGTSAGRGKCGSGDFVSAGVFVFGSSLKESSDMMERLNNASGGCAASGGFVYGSSKKGSSEKLNTRETSTGSGDNVNGDSAAAGVFVFGSSTERSSDSCKPSAPHSEVNAGEESKNGGFVFGKIAVNTLHDNSEKSKIGSETENNVGAMPFNFTIQPEKQDHIGKRVGSGTSQEELKTTEQDASQSAKETSWREQVDVDNGFVSGTSEYVSKVESFVGSTLKFSFGAEQDLSSVIGSVPLPPFQATATPPFCPPPPGPSFQQVGAQFTFTSQPGGLEEKHVEFRAPNHNASRLANENVFSGSSQNIAFSAKRGDSRGTKLKKNKGKSRQTAPNHHSFAKQFVPTEGGSQENPETEPTDGYSPMDYSPYREETTADRYSREASVVSDNSSLFVSRCASADTQKSISAEKEEVLVEKLGFNRSSDVNQGEVHENGSKDHFPGRASAASSFEGEKTFGYGKKSDMPKYENVVFGCDTRTATMKAETGSIDLKVEASAGENGFIFSSSVEDFGQSKLSFTSSSFVKGPLSAQKRNHRRKSKTKPGHDSHLSTPNASVTFASPSPDINPPTSTSMLTGSGQEQKDISFVSRNEDGSKAEKSKEPDATQESTLPASRVAVLEACEKWRYRGNQAYSNGYFSKAEDYYTRGIDSVSLKEAVSSCIRPLTLCYSNRAATRMSLGRMREAIDDCKMALAIDPNFLRAQVRAANCYLSLGEIGETLKAFKKCLQAQDVNCNQKIITEASDGLQKAQQVADLTGQVSELLLKRTSNDASKALQIISEALFISPLSESLMEMKAEALLMMRKYEEVIQFCEGTLDLAEKNSIVPEVDSQLKDASSGLLRSSPATLWRWHLISKSYFHLGKLEEALELLQKHENVKPAVDKYGNRSSDSATSLASTIHELLRLKAAGNVAFQAARHSEAVECYTAALGCNAESRPFAAVCFCNRAAAYQALGQIVDAIADCSLAIALDASYPKAISRRATLHEMIRDYGQATNDLHRLISVLEKRLEEKDNRNGASGGSIGYNSDLRKAQMRLARMEEEARKGRSLDMYMILGIEPSSSAADVKKAYRKAALRHHPDKAGQFLVRNENVDDGLWREVANEVHTDADRLFKIIGESYTTLSDPTKRLQYDAEEEMRTNLKKGYTGPSTPRAPADSYSSYYERNTSRRQWRAYGSSSYQW
ncbi:Uncharacterized protein M6B38_245350 [Iris pallida]|uniref:J domain-containing protein n=1 Tax=Iris pallida TaxID=29817 RepID=A0AAX6DHF3_IRIPA|nr:Uncharacterized protein M6B38_245350 [Iris pallida]